ncbi:MAG TPA: nitroreductase family protein [Candidatus Krumholzibacteria bacterium]|nr:nitroreductase family protein [Candidatus Krumholzibacteria bacterium]HPD73059.1 nitroreductase family protein [Candidatus Krumholzibacteria bacterium]HRY41859.1 nitroreductase family protein [Candidatus Krumholzibacteria bacterium]
MDVRRAIESRRSIQHFDPAFRLDPRVVDELLALTLLSPTSFNIQHCRYVIVDDPELRRQLRAVSYDQSQVTDASLLVVVCADLQAWRKQPERYWRHVSAPLRASFVAAMRDYYESNEQAQRDECLRSTGIAAQTLMLAAEGFGLGSCPMNGFDPDAVARLIGLPADHVLSLFVAIGKPLRPAHPRGGRLPPSEVIVRDRFPQEAG